jgi:PIN domain nuclease of toxin-antitoxin system
VIDVVLDASAVLADFQGEPGAEAVRAAMTSAAISAVNFAEVITKLIDHGMPGMQAQALAETAAYHVVEVDQTRAALAGLMHEKTRRTGVSMGDRFCLALAQETGARALTADRRWKDLDLGVTITLIR